MTTRPGSRQLTLTLRQERSRRSKHRDEDEMHGPYYVGCLETAFEGARDRGLTDLAFEADGLAGLAGLSLELQPVRSSRVYKPTAARRRRPVTYLPRPLSLRVRSTIR